MFPLRCIFLLIVEAINFLTDTCRSLCEVVKARKTRGLEENKRWLWNLSTEWTNRMCVEYMVCAVHALCTCQHPQQRSFQELQESGMLGWILDAYSWGTSPRSSQDLFHSTMGTEESGRQLWQSGCGTRFKRTPLSCPESHSLFPYKNLPKLSQSSGLCFGCQTQNLSKLCPLPVFEALLGSIRNFITFFYFWMLISNSKSLLI